MITRINHLIESLGITQKEFAQQIGVSPASLSHITSGRNRPSLEIVTKILSKYHQISPDWLLFGRGDMTISTHEAVINTQTNNLRSQNAYAGNQSNNSNLQSNSAIQKDPIVIQKQVDHIIVFYEDNTYCTFYPK